MLMLIITGILNELDSLSTDHHQPHSFALLSFFLVITNLFSLVILQADPTALLITLR